MACGVLSLASVAAPWGDSSFCSFPFASVAKVERIVPPVAVIAADTARTSSTMDDASLRLEQRLLCELGASVQDAAVSKTAGGDRAGPDTVPAGWLTSSSDLVGFRLGLVRHRSRPGVKDGGLHRLHGIRPGRRDPSAGFLSLSASFLQNLAFHDR
jgi:hypothetical protein